MMLGILPVVISNAAIAAVLALLVIVVTKLWRSPQLAHGLWALVLLKLITPPVAGVMVPDRWLGLAPDPQVIKESGQQTLPSPAATTMNEAAAAVVPVDERNDSGRTDEERKSVAVEIPAVEVTQKLSSETRLDAWTHSVNWLHVAGAIWIGGSCVCVGLLGWRCFRFRRLLSAAEDAGKNVTSAAELLAIKLGLPNCPPILTIDAPIPPLVWSHGLRPMVLLPAGLLGELEPAQRDAVIAHELAHVRRGDHLVRWLEVIALITFWWNPVAWYARRKLREAEEECCDAWVVWAMPEERRSYGQAMLKTIEFLTDGPALPALAGSTFGRTFYKRRIEMIMQRNINRRMSWMALATVGLLAVTVLPLFAQTGDEPAQADSENLQPVASDQVHSTFTAQNNDEQPGADDPKLNVVEDRALRTVEELRSVQELKQRRAKLDKLTEQLRRLTEELMSSVLNDSGTQPDAADDLNTENRGAGFETIGQANSLEVILKRITALEQSLKELQDDAERRTTSSSRLTNPAASVTGSRPYASTTVASHIPRFSISPDTEEQGLQERLLELDVEAAEEALASAQRRFEQMSQLGDVVSGKELDTQRDRLREQEIQLKRAKTVIQLFKLQAKRQSEQAEHTNAVPYYDSGNGEKRTGRAVRVRFIDANAAPIARQMFLIEGSRSGGKVLNQVGRTDQDGWLKFIDTTASDEIKVAMRFGDRGPVGILSDAIKVPEGEVVELTVEVDGQSAKAAVVPSTY